MSVEIKDIDPIPVVGMTHTGPYNEIGDTFGRLFGKAGAAGWPMRGTLGVYFDDPEEVPEDKLQSAACIITTEGFDPGDEEVEAFSVEGGRYAVMRHVGPYSGLGDAWMKFFGEELPKLNMDYSGPPFEQYMNDPNSTPAQELIVDLHIPVKPK